MDIGILVPAATFGAVLLIVMAAYWMFIDRPETKARIGIRKRLRRTAVAKVAQVDLEKEAKPACGLSISATSTCRSITCDCR